MQLSAAGHTPEDASEGIASGAVFSAADDRPIVTILPNCMTVATELPNRLGDCVTILKIKRAGNWHDKGCCWARSEAKLVECLYAESCRMHTPSRFKSRHAFGLGQGQR